MHLLGQRKSGRMTIERAREIIAELERLTALHGAEIVERAMLTHTRRASKTDVAYTKAIIRGLLGNNGSAVASWSWPDVLGRFASKREFLSELEKKINEYKKK
jgi:hypothetical protein